MWTPEHKDWELSHWDKELVRAEDCETRDAFRAFTPTPVTPCHILDVGCGSGRVARDVLSAFGHVTLSDLEARPGVIAVDLRLPLPFVANSFHFVHARRVLSNLQEADRAAALKEMLRVSSHAVIICDCWEAPRESIENMLARSGLAMPPRSEGFGGLRQLVECARVEHYTVAAAWYYWTRCLGPIIYRRQLDDFDRSAPGLACKVPLEFAVHRVSVLRK